MNEKVKPFLIDYYRSSPNVKLLAYKAGLGGHLPVKNLVERDVGVGLVGQGRKLNVEFDFEMCPE